jgi:hypothetical protein
VKALNTVFRVRVNEAGQVKKKLKALGYEILNDFELVKALKGDPEKEGDDDMAVNKLLAREFGVGADATADDLAQAIVRDRKAHQERIADLEQQLAPRRSSGSSKTGGRSPFVTASDEIVSRAQKLAREERLAMTDAMTRVAIEDPALYDRYRAEQNPYSPEGQALAEQRRAAAMSGFVRTLSANRSTPAMGNTADARLMREIEAVAKSRNLKFNEAADIVAKDRPDLVEALAHEQAVNAMRTVPSMAGMPGVRMGPGEEVV